MTSLPKITCFLFQQKPAQKENPLWNQPIPLSRHSYKDTPEDKADDQISYGDYFSAVRDFLQRNEFQLLTDALSRRANRQIELKDIKEIQIHLEKHGAFYHPSRIETVGEGLKIPLVLNVALSKTGRECINKEFEILKTLNTRFGCAYLPEVYGRGDIYTKDNLKVGMFLGEWFEGYNEFHISFNNSDAKKKIRVWDPVQGPVFLTLEQTRQLYCQAALILTSYYDLETFEQILPWSHGAGDFVLKLVEGRIKLRLVSARGYTSLIKDKNRDPQSILEALLVFLLNLTIRMRLDRIDGTGDVVWSDDFAVEETISGLFQGLALKPPIPLFADPLDVCFKGYLSFWAEKELYDLAETIVNLYDSGSPDVPVMRKNLKAHVKILSAVKNDPCFHSDTGR
jgi:hypothetical protein